MKKRISFNLQDRIRIAKFLNLSTLSSMKYIQDGDKEENLSVAGDIEQEYRDNIDKRNTKKFSVTRYAKIYPY